MKTTKNKICEYCNQAIVKSLEHPYCKYTWSTGYIAAMYEMMTQYGIHPIPLLKDINITEAANNLSRLHCKSKLKVKNEKN